MTNQDVSAADVEVVLNQHVHVSFIIRDGEQTKFITQGTYIGKTGRGNNNEHLHMGLLISRAQKSGDYLPAMQFQNYLKSLLVKENRI